MSYEIIIKKTSTKDAFRRGQHTVIDKRPWTQEELSDKFKYSYADGGVEAFLGKNPLKEVIGYAPDILVSEKIETEILKQTVDDLDLAAVIKAINRL